jgi:hypothetical protein
MVAWVTPDGTVKLSAVPVKEKVQVTVVVPVQDGVAPAGVVIAPTPAASPPTSEAAPRNLADRCPS